MKKMRLLIIFLTILAGHGTAQAIELNDVSQNWMFRGNLVSAFPQYYDLIPKEENANIIRIFHYFQGDVSNPLNERRIEVFYTGGDWMEFGYTYLVTNSPNARHRIYPDNAGAYFIQELSTTDREDGAMAPMVDPLDPEAIKCFIRDRFLTEYGDVREGLKPLSAD